MFQADTAFAVELIAIAAGMALVVWMKIHAEHTCKFCRGLSHLVVLLAILALACTSYYTFKYWSAGLFNSSRVMQHHQMKSHMMKKCKMMGCMKACMMKKCKMMDCMKTGMTKKCNVKSMQNGMMQGKMPMMDQKGIQDQKMQKQMPMDKSMMDKNSKAMPMQDMPIDNATHESHHK